MNSKDFFGYLKEDGKAVLRAKLKGPEEIAGFVCEPKHQRYCRLVTDAQLELKIVEFSRGDNVRNVQAAFGDAVKMKDREAIENAILKEQKRVEEREESSEVLEEDWTNFPFDEEEIDDDFFQER